MYYVDNKLLSKLTKGSVIQNSKQEFQQPQKQLPDAWFQIMHYDYFLNVLDTLLFIWEKETTETTPQINEFLRHEMFQD